MDNVLYTVYDRMLLKEGVLEVPQRVFADVLRHVANAYKQIEVKGLKRITDKSFPPRIFNLDFTGTNWEFLNETNPRVEVQFSFSDKSSYYQNVDPSGKNPETIKTGKGYIVFLLKEDMINTLMSTIEHEISHFIQYDIVTYKIKKGQLPDMPVSEYKDNIGGLPSKRYQSKSVDTSGYKTKTDSWMFTTKALNQSNKVISYSGGKLLTIKAKTPEEALIKVKQAVPSISRSYPDAIAIPRHARRVQHTARPVEYFPDLQTLLRTLQYFAQLNPTLSKKQILLDVINRKPVPLTVNGSRFLSRAIRILANFKSNLHNPKFYNHILAKLYNAFVNKDFKKDYDEIKNIIDQTNKEIEQARQVKQKQDEHTYPLGLKEEDFTAIPYKFAPIDVWLTDLDDENTDTTRTILDQLGLKPKYSKYYDQENYIIPMNYVAIKNLFRKFKNLIHSSQNVGDKLGGVKDGESLSDFKIYVQASKEMFDLIRKHLRHYSGSQKELPIELWKLLIS